jgi:hypothetical protein
MGSMRVKMEKYIMEVMGAAMWNIVFDERKLDTLLVGNMVTLLLELVTNSVGKNSTIKNKMEDTIYGFIYHFPR